MKRIKYLLLMLVLAVMLVGASACGKNTDASTVVSEAEISSEASTNASSEISVNETTSAVAETSMTVGADESVTVAATSKVDAEHTKASDTTASHSVEAKASTAATKASSKAKATSANKQEKTTSAAKQTKASSTTKAEKKTEAEKKCSCKFTVDGGRDAGVFYSGTLGFTGKTSVYDLLKKSGVSYSGDGNYVSEIEGLAEFDHGNMSGWLYSVNGTTPMKSCGSYIVSDGDVIRWHYQYDD